MIALCNYCSDLRPSPIQGAWETAYLSRARLRLTEFLSCLLEPDSLRSSVLCQHPKLILLGSDLEAHRLGSNEATFGFLRGSVWFHVSLAVIETLYDVQYLFPNWKNPPRLWGYGPILP